MAMNQSGVFRYKRILDQFTIERSVWTVAELAARLEVATSTLYRQMRELVAIGFLEGTVDAQYRLGPAFVEFERRLRHTDPLLKAGEVFLGELIKQSGFECSAILARLYGNKVMCVADAHNPNIQLKSSFERGLPMPFIKSATARVILSVMETRRLKRLLSDETELEGNALETFRADLAETRRQGYLIAQGELDPGAIGLAVPITHRAMGIEASLSIVAHEKDVPKSKWVETIQLLSATAAEIETFLSDQYAQATVPPAP